MTRRSCRVVIAAALILPLSAAPPPAAAVVPPGLDDEHLPPATAPNPAQATEQRQPCFAAGTGTEVAAHPLGLDAVWRLTRGAGQTVAVIDTGVARHRLLPHLYGGGDYVSHSDGTADCDGHGTIIAGIIGAAPTPDGFSGVAPDAAILAIRQSSNKFAVKGGAMGVGDVETLARAVRTAADRGATVINISSVACVAAERATPDQALDDRALGAALAYAVDVKNAVVVTAAGNVGGPGHCPEQNPVAGRRDWDGLRSVSSPGWYDDLVLCVGSADKDGNASSFTLAGPWVDVAAPGENVVSLHPDGDHLIDKLSGKTPISGTSYASAVMAGVAALVRARFPQLTARQVMQRINSTARRPSSGWNPLLGNGVVDALAAVSDNGDGRVALPVTPTAVAPAAGNPDDPGPRRVAFGGAAVCLAAATLLAAAASTRRLRRRAQAVTHD